MRIIHRVSTSSSPTVQRQLARLGVAVADSGFVSFDVDESAAAWPALQEWITRHQAVDVCSTRFSKAELLEARWLELVPDWHHGYPQPDEDNFGYLSATYERGSWCERCGVGLEQNAPFQMKREPKWGKRGIMQLNWVFDEFFATPDVWTTIFEPHGVGCRPVLTMKGVELGTVVQLVACEEVGVVADRLLTEESGCAACGRTKYLPVTRGRFPALASQPASAMVKTREYFGSGASASKAVLVSRSLARALVSSKIRGASLVPVVE